MRSTHTALVAGAILIAGLSGSALANDGQPVRLGQRNTAMMTTQIVGEPAGAPALDIINSTPTGLALGVQGGSVGLVAFGSRYSIVGLSLPRFAGSTAGFGFIPAHARRARFPLSCQMQLDGHQVALATLQQPRGSTWVLAATISAPAPPYCNPAVTIVLSGRVTRPTKVSWLVFDTDQEYPLP